MWEELGGRRPGRSEALLSELLVVLNLFVHLKGKGRVARGRWGENTREISHLLVSYSNTCKSQGRARLKPGLPRRWQESNT